MNNADIVAALKRIRPHYLPGAPYEIFICHALTAVGAKWVAENIIQARLRSATYGCWLRRHHPEVADRYERNYDGQYFHAARLAWIDNLIEEFSK